MTGQPRVINEPDVQQAMQTPPSTAGKAGKFAEQALEFMAPSGIIGKTGKAIEATTAGMRAAKALNLAGRVGLEAASAAGVTGLQTGGDPEAMRQAALTAGVTTGALGAATEGLTKLAPALKESALAQYKRVLQPTKEGTKFLSKTKSCRTSNDCGRCVTEDSKARPRLKSRSGARPSTTHMPICLPEAPPT
jgi:hypothetical protein